MCPLCNHTATQFYFKDNRRRFFQCVKCQLVFVDQTMLPTPTEEKQEYEKHNNCFDDVGYQTFLRKALNAATKYTNINLAKCRYLDFGCGPAPVLAAMASRVCQSASYYDPLFFPNGSCLKHCYEVISCTEAIEHFHRPIVEWEILMSMMTLNSLLVIMTKRVISKERFANWHYKNDMTHVSFFSEYTFHFLAEKYGLEVVFPEKDIALFSKP